MDALNGNALHNSAPGCDTTKRKTVVSVAHSRVRQDRLMNTSTVGGRCQATGGGFLNSDEFLISQERKRRKQQVGELEKKTKSCQEEYKRAQKRRERGKLVVETYMTSKLKYLII